MEWFAACAVADTMRAAEVNKVAHDEPYKCLLGWSAFEEMCDLRTSPITTWNACIDTCIKNPIY